LITLRAFATWGSVGVDVAGAGAGAELVELVELAPVPGPPNEVAPEASVFGAGAWALGAGAVVSPGVAVPAGGAFETGGGGGASVKLCPGVADE
jgi:hypothetical protein